MSNTGVKKGRRSARLYYKKNIVTQMDGDHTIVDRTNSRPCHPTQQEMAAHPERYYNIYTMASSSAENREPYRAFTGQTTDGWLTVEGGLEASWILVSPGVEWRSPRNGMYYDVICLDVYNPPEDNKSIKRFFFQGLRQSDDEWETIKACDIKKPDRLYKSGYVIHLQENTIYTQYRIVVHEIFNENQTQVGFSKIVIYAMCDHQDCSFGVTSINGITVPRYHERLYMVNEENGCDGIIWEKKHNENLIICSNTYSYSYSGYAACVMIHPDEKYVNGVMKPLYMDPSLSAMTRSKNYGIYQNNYYNYYGDYDPAGRPIYVTRDGIHWKKTDGIHTSDGFSSNWSPKEDVGLVFGLDKRDSRLSDRFQYQINKLEIDEDGTVNQTYLGHYKIDFPEDLIFCGDVMLHDDGDGTEFFSAWDHDGHKYTTSLKRWYTWNDHGTSRVGYFNYYFYVMGGKYIAASKRIIGNTSTSYTAYTYELYVSTDGFKTGVWYDLAGPYWSDGSDWDYRIMYFDEKWLCLRYNSQNDWYYIRDFGNDLGGTCVDRALIRSSKFDLQGQFTQHTDNVERLILKIGYRDSPTPGNREKLVSLNGYGYPEINRTGCGKTTLYFKDGKISEPYGYMVAPVDYTFGEWDADYITFFVFDGDFTREPTKKMCFTSKNPMIDPNNPTWKHYW